MKNRLTNRLFIALIRLYQTALSPLIGRSCRFYPSCSNYALWLFMKESAPIALWRSIKRVLRCNPLCKGGIDYPEINFNKKLPKKFVLKNCAIYADRAASKEISWYIIPCKKRFVFIKVGKW